MTAFLLLASLAAAAASDQRSLQVLDQGEALTFVWTLSDDPSWLSPYDGQDPRYKKFARGVRAALDAQPSALIKRQRAVFAKNGRSTAQLDWALARLPLIRPLGKLQAVLFMTHWRDENPQGREFQALILHSPGLFRVHYTRASKDGSWPMAKKSRELAARDLAAGWKLYAHLHNHPFFPENPHGDLAGTPVPSDDDSELYRELAVWGRLERAWLTNGLNTLEVPVAEFPRVP
jgi:hypothetical protein